MKTTAFKDFTFSAAHYLKIPDHPCSVMHGHNYRVRIECSGQVNTLGMVVDFNEIKRKVDPIIKKLDHKVINDVIFGGTTSEYIAAWIFKQANDQLGNVVRVTLFETDTCGAIVEK
jgi:6-pyruvoyltetrahydropterin/6-carboxytetrahydropterin synthase